MARETLAEKYRRVSNEAHKRGADPETRRFGRRRKLLGEMLVRAILRDARIARDCGLLSIDYVVDLKKECAGSGSYAGEELERKGFRVSFGRLPVSDKLCVKINW